MTRKAAWCGLSFLAGTFLFCTVGQHFFAASALCVIALSLLALFCFPKDRVYVTAVGISAFCGLSCAGAYALLRISPAHELDGRNVTMTGTVTDCKALGSDSYVLTVDGEAEGVSCTVMFYADRECEPYSEVTVTGQVEALEDTVSFSSKTYYLPKGIYLRGTADTVEPTGGYARPFMRIISKLRNYTEKCIFAYTDSESASFLQALICGDKSEMDDVTKTKLYRSGVGHIFAVSGTHIAVVVMFIGAIFSLFIRSVRARTAILCFTAVAFAAFGGMSPSVTRACVMTVLVCTASVMGRRTDVLSSLGICAVLMCGIQPFCCLSPSFICSFAACYALGCIVPKLAAPLKESKLRFVTVPLLTTLVISAVVMPFQLILFPTVSLIAPIAGVVIVPLCCIALILTVLAMLMGGSLLPSQVCFRLADYMIKLVLKLTDFFASLDFAAVGTGNVRLILLGTAVIGGALIFAVIRKRTRTFVLCSAGVFVMMWAVQTVADVLDRGNLRIKVFSNGQNLCAVVTSAGECSIIDIGARGTYNYGVQQYICRNGIRRVRNVFILRDLGAEQYKAGLYPAPERVYTELGVSGEEFPEGASAELRDCVIERTDTGYDIIVNGERYRLERNRLTLPDGGYYPAEELKKQPEIVNSEQ